MTTHALPTDLYQERSGMELSLRVYPQGEGWVVEFSQGFAQPCTTPTDGYRRPFTDLSEALAQYARTAAAEF